MFIGHAAVGFASKAAAPRVSLGVLLAAPFLLDLLWPVFVLTGIESARIEPGNTAFSPIAFDSYPWSHSLLMAILWAALLGAFVHLALRSAAAGAVVALGVVSHWICDAVVHRPDLPLMPGGSLFVGMGLWNSRAATLAVEVPLFALGVWIYVRMTRPKDAIGRWALAALVAFLLAAYAGAAFGPPPPNVAAVAWTALALVLLIPWAVWIDRHRVTEPSFGHVDTIDSGPGG
ncbi:MAG: metal-dependent hydrolase [Acidobacteriota bacterium]